MMMTSAYWEAEDIAIDQERDLTVENNLRNDFLINRLDFFKNKGFTTSLIFFLLPDVETSVERVSLRIAQKGHFVDLESIKYNFEESLIRLKQHFDKFNNLRIVDSSLSQGISFPKTLLLVKNKRLVFVEPNKPLWAKPIIDELAKRY
jgi:predicted ABC-type ATPase